MKILTPWLRHYLSVLDVDDAQLAEDLTLRGIAVEGVFEMNDVAGESDGTVFEMDLTTNRVDAMNHYGIAREAAAIYNVGLHALDTHMPDSVAGQAFPVRIEAEAEDRCGRFTARVIRGVTVGPSEGRLAHWFGELGQRCISNAVDASNFVMLGMGQPTHAFDLDKIEGGIVVRLAKNGELLKLLDGTTRTLVPDDLVIADERKALGLAGVMGGWDSMITAETRNVLVEAAWFAPAGIRASSRRHGIHTDASHRFERGADFNAAPAANALVTRQILEACGGWLDGELVDVVVPALASQTVGRPAVALSMKQVRRHLGTTLDETGITREIVARYLHALGCELTELDEDLFLVKLPSWRLDLTREIDLIEEIARVYGYNRFANTLPAPGVMIAHPTARPEQAIRTRLLALGYSEAISPTFSSPEDALLFAPRVEAVTLENPLNDEVSQLRPSLLPGMVAMLAHNLNRDVSAVRLFEAGARFAGLSGDVEEEISLAIGLTGEFPPVSPLMVPGDTPFYELKGVVEALLGLFQVPTPVSLLEEVPGYFAPGRAVSLRVGGKPVGSFGQLAVAEQQRRKLRQPIWLAELDLAALLRFPRRQATAQDVSRFQAVERDFSFTFPDRVRWADVVNAVETLGIAELQRTTPIEIWRDGKKYPGVYSSLIRMVFQSGVRTLRDEDLSGWQNSIIAALTSLGGTHRKA